LTKKYNDTKHLVSVSSVLRTAVGKTLFDSLGELLVGNHLEQRELTVSEERHERYMATCSA